MASRSIQTTSASRSFSLASPPVRGRYWIWAQGLSRLTLLATLKSLQQKQLIVAEKRSSAEKGFETNSYSLNFNAPLLRP